VVEIPVVPPVIQPVSPSENRPLWSVMIPVYNCAHYLAEAIESVLQQEIPEYLMQIEVVDDASTDADVEKLVNEIGRGRVGYFRQPTNVGSLRNFETCINLSKGKLIHLLHADDKVRRGYYKKIETLFAKWPQAGAAYCGYRSIDGEGNQISVKSPEMDKDGLLGNWLITISERQRIQYAAITVRREVYEKLGSFFGVVYGEDWEMWVRIAKHYPVAYTPDILAEYRKHAGSISDSRSLNSSFLHDLLQAMMLIQKHLPAEKRDVILKKSKRYYAAYGLKVANKTWISTQNKSVAIEQVRACLKMSDNPELYMKAIIFYIKLIFSRR
jgi:glycosyltransferase involved in cell wall biosynthesis